MPNGGDPILKEDGAPLVLDAIGGGGGHLHAEDQFDQRAHGPLRAGTGDVVLLGDEGDAKIGAEDGAEQGGAADGQAVPVFLADGVELALDGGEMDEQIFSAVQNIFSQLSEIQVPMVTDKQIDAQLRRQAGDALAQGGLGEATLVGHLYEIGVGTDCFAAVVNVKIFVSIWVGRKGVTRCHSYFLLPVDEF